MDQVKNSVIQLCHPSDSELLEILEHLKARSIEKGDALLREGNICSQYYFVEKGSLRLFYDKEGTDYTVWIGTAGEIFTDLESYIEQVPTRINIEALEPSDVYVISKEESDQLAKKSNAYNTLLRKTVEIAFVGLAKNVMSFQSDSAQERYRRVEEEKNWIAKYPLKYVSSFIGITQSTLSKLRSKKD